MQISSSSLWRVQAVQGQGCHCECDQSNSCQTLLLLLMALNSLSQPHYRGDNTTALRIPTTTQSRLHRQVLTSSPSQPSRLLRNYAWCLHNRLENEYREIRREDDIAGSFGFVFLTVIFLAGRHSKVQYLGFEQNKIEFWSERIKKSWNELR